MRKNEMNCDDYINDVVEMLYKDIKTLHESEKDASEKIAQELMALNALVNAWKVAD